MSLRFKALTLSSLAALAALLGLSACDQLGGGGSDSDEDRAALNERASLAWEAMQAFVDSLLSGTTGAPDAALVRADFSLDGLDRTAYLARFWTSDDAEYYAYTDPNNGELVEGATQIDFAGSRVSRHDTIVLDVQPPADLSSPVRAEIAVFGETRECASPSDSFDTCSLVREYQAIGSFQMLEEANGMRIAAPGPLWEYETLAEPPAKYHFVVNQLGWGASLIYQGVNVDRPTFLFSNAVSAPGDVIDVTIIISSVGSIAAPIPLLDRVTCRADLFLAESPAAAAFGGMTNTTSSKEFTNILFEPVRTTTLVLRVPDTLGPGWYSLVVTVENTEAGITYATDRIVFPIEVVE